MIRKLIALFALGIAVGVATAQNNTNYTGLTRAYAFAYGVNTQSAPLQVTNGASTAGTYAVTLALGQTTAEGGTTFSPFAGCTSATTCPPITIGAGTSIETVTPTSASCSTPAQYNTCTVTATFAFAHGMGDSVKSGDFGLQESARYVVGKGGGLVVLDPTWFQNTGGHAAGLAVLVAQRSLATGVYTVLDYSGISGVFSYAAASGSVYASTAHVLY